MATRKQFSDPVVGALAKLLADTYLLYVKTQNYHWNVTGELFPALHAMFEEQYDELSEATDLLAEQIRSLHEVAPGTMQQFLELSSLTESAQIPSAQKMIQDLYEDHIEIMEELAKNIELAQEHGDEGTADVFIERLRAHQKTAWMLKSSLSSQSTGAKVTKIRP